MHFQSGADPVLIAFCLVRDVESIMSGDDSKGTVRRYSSEPGNTGARDTLHDAGEMSN